MPSNHQPAKGKSNSNLLLLESATGETWTSTITIRKKKIQQLELDKVIAIQNENYDLAKQIKVQMGQLKAVETQLQALKAQKTVAIAKVYFDVAKRIKQQMD